MPNFSEIKIEVDDVKVTDADIDEQIQSLRTRFGTLTTVEKSVATGDFVTIDLVATKDGAALEGGSAGIRFNGINPDAVFDNSKLWEGGIREQRAAAHGVKPEELEDFYASRNLLNARVRSLDVARAAAFLLSSLRFL